MPADIAVGVEAIGAEIFGAAGVVEANGVDGDDRAALGLGEPIFELDNATIGGVPELFELALVGIDLVADFVGQDVVEVDEDALGWFSVEATTWGLVEGLFPQGLDDGFEVGLGEGDRL